MKYLTPITTGMLIICLSAAGSLFAADATEAFSLDEQLGKDLELTLWAKSPMIHSPVAMDVDPQGRMWVVEDLLKSEKASKGVRSRILVMEDTDQDGKADIATPFGPTFSTIPYGIAVFDNVIVVSASPDLTVFTDVNRNGLFENDIDTREVLLTGFQGRGHDHSLHAVVGSPSGEWQFSQGNTGADVKTPDGRAFHATSYYSRNHGSTGLKSSDGHLYVGGFGLRMQPDGTQAAITFHNARNTHDLFITSFGDHLHTDNDDPAHARASWVMPYANYGYASLEDGSRSWEEAAKSWDESAALDKDGMPARTRFNKGHWREHSPGTSPPGAMWGAGAPTGNVFIEGDELGPQLRGTYVFCETVNKALFAYRPKHVDSQIEMTDKTELLALKESKERDWPRAFLPSDVVSGLDGSLYLSDWNSFANRSNKGTPDGAIYRIARKGKSGNNHGSIWIP
jgi:putative membrane-bound dehydrogenase-like protein